MIKAQSISISLFILMLLGAATQADMFVPPDEDIQDLTHQKYYIWGIDWTVPAGETITKASLTISDLHNWDSNYNILHVHLLDNATVGLNWGYDWQGGGDYFDNVYSEDHTQLFELENVPPTPPTTYTYNFNQAQIAALKDYLQDGNFGIGMDPDCHYYNTGVDLQIGTVIPAPGSMLLGIIGLAMIVRINHRFA
jgi:hypothetical protein